MTSDTPWNHPELKPELLGRRIRAARKAAGLTQAQIGGAEASVAYISRIEAGQRRPSHRLLTAIAERLATTVLELTGPGTADQHSDLRVTLAQAELALAEGSTEDALRELSELIVSADTAGLRALGDHATTIHAGAHLADGRAADALRTLMHRFGTHAETISSVRVSTLLGCCYLEIGQVSEAVRAAEQGARTIDEYDLHGLPEAVDHATAYARALIDNNESLRAVRVCRDALNASARVTTFPELAEAYWHASVQEALAGATTQAASHLTLAAAAREIEHHQTLLPPLLEQLERALEKVELQAF